MITLILINFVLTTANTFLVNHFSNFITPITSLGTYLHSFTIPQTFLDIYSIAVYFLPMGTIITLFGFTVLIIVAKLILTIIKIPGSLLFGN